MMDNGVHVERDERGLCSWCNSAATTEYRGDPACVPCSRALEAQYGSGDETDDVFADAEKFRHLAPPIAWTLLAGALVGLSMLVARFL
jgi:hypothetical protein